ncbi:MAG TPA: chemotaxis protein CheW [Planctomycetota bacterium]|nr:chemotaxis protein CheW [Planctomycetota bacterium]
MTDADAATDVEALRRAFDADFASAPPPPPPPRTGLLAAQVGPARLAVELKVVAHVAVLGAGTSLPGARPELIGLFDLRGVVVPVFCLGSLLGLPTGARRFAAVVGDGRVAVAFEGPTSRLDVETSRLRALRADGGDGPRFTTPLPDGRLLVDAAAALRAVGVPAAAFPLA